jgi:hypothetical protein
VGWSTESSLLSWRGKGAATVLLTLVLLLQKARTGKVSQAISRHVTNAIGEERIWFRGRLLKQRILLWPRAKLLRHEFKK